jgi:esterase
VVLLHGLFGAGNNLGALARSLAERYTVHSLDLPNHGRSAWSVSAGIGAMADAVVHWIAGQGLEEVSLVGHSLGGKVAMEIALSRRSDVRALVAADIAPVAYPPRHEAVFAGLAAVAATPCSSRQEAASRMSEYISEREVIQFLLNSLQRGDNGIYRWRFNLDGILADYPALCDRPPSQGPYNGPVQFIRGGASDYILEVHRGVITSLFPRAGLKTMPGCGHWLHVEQPEGFNRLVGRFLDTQVP